MMYNTHSNVEQTMAAITTAGNYQVQAVASAWKQNPAKKIQGVCLDTCQRIMNTMEENPTPPEISAWMLEVAYKTNADGGWNGGWVLYLHVSEDKWQAAAAGSVRITRQHNQTHVAAEVIHQGLQCLGGLMELQKVFLRINTLDKKIRKLEELAEDTLEPLRQTMNDLFGYLWEQSQQDRLKAAKFLATLGNNQFFDMNTNQQEVIKDFIRTTVPQHSASIGGTQRQTQDLISRLTTYQASIETKT